MQVNSIVSIVSSKGGVGKTTTSVNLGSIAADAGLKALLIDLDGHPPQQLLSPRIQRIRWHLRSVGAQRHHRRKHHLAHQHAGLDIILSNDPHNELETLRLHAPDGRLRLRSLLKRLPACDLVIIDTKGTSAVTVEIHYPDPEIRELHRKRWPGCCLNWVVHGRDCLAMLES